MDLGTAEVGALLGVAGVVLALVADRRALLLPGLAAVGAAEALLVSSTIPPRPILVVPGLVALAALVAGAFLFVRHPALVLPAALVAAPFRAPLEFDTDNRFFVGLAEQGDLGRLVLLYAVIGAAALALAWSALHGSPVAPLPRPLAIPTAAFLALACLSLLWTLSERAGADLLAFFLLPFAVLLATAGRAPFPDWMPKTLAAISIALASLFAAIGIYEAATHRVVAGSPEVDVSNTFRSFFRVTSLFSDPSLFGRTLVLALVVVVAALLLSRFDVRAGGALVALLGAALFFTYSQSSMVALFVAALGLLAAALPARLRIVIAVAAAGLVAVTAVAVAAEGRNDSIRRVTSDRSTRIEDAARVVADRPVLGAGIGGQPEASRRLAHRRAGSAAFVSHTTPLTVAAELGAVGLALYVALLAGTAWTIDQVRRRNRVLGLTLAAALVALFVHALAYSGFFEDPLTWFVLAVASSFLVSAEPSERAVTP